MVAMISLGIPSGVRPSGEGEGREGGRNGGRREGEKVEE